MRAGTSAIAMLLMLAPSGWSAAAARQAAGQPAQLNDPTTLPRFGERVGKRLNDRRNPRSRSVVVRAHGSNTSQLEIPTVEENLARRR